MPTGLASDMRARLESMVENVPKRPDVALPATTVLRVGFYEYVKQMASGESDERIAANLGIVGSTVSRWKAREPHPRDVSAFARFYHRPVLEAFIRAGFMTAEEAGQTINDVDPRRLSDEELVSEISRRLQVAADRVSPGDVSTSDRLKRRQAEDRRLKSQERERLKRDQST